MADTPPLCAAFVAVAELCAALGEHPLTRYEGCWECKVDERWRLAVNGHKEPKRCSFSSIPVEPFTCYVTFNDWPAFIFGPYGGGGATGALANEDTFIGAVLARTERAKAKPRPPVATAWPFPGESRGG